MTNYTIDNRFVPKDSNLNSINVTLFSILSHRVKVISVKFPSLGVHRTPRTWTVPSVPCKDNAVLEEDPSRRHQSVEVGGVSTTREYGGDPKGLSKRSNTPLKNLENFEVRYTEKNNKGRSYGSGRDSLVLHDCPTKGKAVTQGNGGRVKVRGETPTPVPPVYRRGQSDREVLKR